MRRASLELLEAIQLPARVPYYRQVGKRIATWWRSPHHRTWLGKIGHRLVNSRYWHTAILVCIVINTVTLCLDRYPTDGSFTTTVETINFVLTLVFALDVVCKLSAEGVRTFCHDSWNLFDALVVAVSLIELGLSWPPQVTVMNGWIGSPTTSGSGGAHGGAGIFTGGNASLSTTTWVSVDDLVQSSFVDGDPAMSTTTSSRQYATALRTFRLLRVFRVARNWKALNVLVRTVLRSVRDAANFALLLAIFVYVFALVGMQIFANR